MVEKSIEEIINKELYSDDRITALDFVAFLRDNELTFFRDKDYWQDKIYFWVKYGTDCVCFIAISDPDEPENRWTVWSENIDSDYLVDNAVEDRLKKIAWEHVDCGSCGSCGGENPKSIFGREFNNVCGTNFRFDNPDMNDLDFMKKMVEIKKRELIEK